MATSAVAAAVLATEEAAVLATEEAAEAAEAAESASLASGVAICKDCAWAASP